MLKNHWKFKINYVNYPETHRKVSGVYLIDDVYIGASKHNRSRIITHCNSALRDCKSNLGLYEYLKFKIINNKPIDIFFIDKDIYKEGFYIDMMKPLYNKTLNSYSNRKIK